MAWLVWRRLQIQLLLILVAGLSLTALSIVLIADAVRGAERVVLADTGRQLAAATAELAQQFSDWVSLEPGRLDLPAEALHVSLRGISEAVLRSYPGVEGGYHQGSRFLGYSFPTHDNPGAKTDMPVAELEPLRAVIEESLRKDGYAERILRGPHDIVMIRAQANPEDQSISWAMKRLPGLSDPGTRRRRWLLVALVIAALLSVGGTMGTALRLQRGVAHVKKGLQALEADFRHRLPEGNDEIGDISRAINKMATMRRQLEAELRREDRLRAMGRLVAGVAHEIGNPLNSIRLSIQFLERLMKDNLAKPEDFQVVIEEVDRLDSLVKDLLVLGKARPPTIETLAVMPVLQRAAKLVEAQAKSRGIQLEMEEASPWARARFDPAQLNQVLLNLLLNAIEATQDGGKIVLHLENSSEIVEIQISDTGPGLSAEQKDHLFEAFFTTKPEGSGLGLAVSKELVENMGGTIQCLDSEQGATFAVRLPAASHA